LEIRSPFGRRTTPTPRWPARQVIIQIIGLIVLLVRADAVGGLF
jgi:hypothetical protein